MEKMKLFVVETASSVVVLRKRVSVEETCVLVVNTSEHVKTMTSSLYERKGYCGGSRQKELADKCCCKHTRQN